MNGSDILTIYDYWATQQILTAGKRVNPEQFIASTTYSHSPGGLDFTAFPNEQ